jgi:hypothetical protein
LSYIRATCRPGCRRPSQVAYRLVPRSRTAGAPAARRATSDDPERMRGFAPGESSPSRAGSFPRVSARSSADLAEKPMASRCSSSGHVSEDVVPTGDYAVPVCGYAASRGRELAIHSGIRLQCPYAGHTAKSQLGMAAPLALDTYLRNGHASVQAQVTVLRTLVRYTATPTGDAYRRRVEVPMTAPPSGPAAARTASAS